VNGPAPATENRLPALAASLSSGWGVELDIRRARDGRFYISHDLQASASGRLADDFFALVRRHREACVAINVKEVGGEPALLAYLDAQRVLPQAFLFDMELVEAAPGTTARLFRRLHPSVRIAARVSDRGEPIERALSIDVASVIWLDEFDRLWCTERDVRRLKEAGRTVYAVSPDLHGFSMNDTRKRWLQFRDWGVDGICTDYPAELERVLAYEEVA
jgi:glycerophosphoryl diester phosphodiesterase